MFLTSWPDETVKDRMTVSSLLTVAPGTTPEML